MLLRCTTVSFWKLTSKPQAENMDQPSCNQPDFNFLRASFLPDWDITLQLFQQKRTTWHVHIHKLDLPFENLIHQKFAACDILWTDTLTDHLIRDTLQIPHQVAGVCTCGLLPGLDVLKSGMCFCKVLFCKPQMDFCEGRWIITAGGFLAHTQRRKIKAGSWYISFINEQ